MKPSHRFLFLAVGIVVLLSSFVISQFSNQNTISSESKIIRIDNHVSTVTAFNLSLNADDRLDVVVNQDSSEIPISVNVSFLGRPSTSSASGINPNLSWICNGNQNYTIDIVLSTFSEGFDLVVTYDLIRPTYYAIWMLPVGLILGGILVLNGLCFDNMINCFGKKIVCVFRSPNSFIRCVNVGNIRSFLKKQRKLEFFTLLLLVVFLLLSLFINVQMLHNDEIGGGETKDWGYYAWGYVDTAEQVAELLKNGDFSYDSWHAVQNMNKPILPILFMSFFIILLPGISPIVASRLFVQISAALACFFVYLLIKNMFGRKTGMLASFLLFFNPIFLHYTRSAYFEGPFIMFASLFLFLLYNVKLDNSRSVYLAGLALGLVLSSKSLLFLYLFFPVTILLLVLKTENALKNLCQLLGTIFRINFIGSALFIILWPYMWLNPFEKMSFLGMFFGLIGKYGPSFSVSYPELFLGTITQANPLFKSLIDLLFQTTYLEILGFVLGLIFIIFLVKSRRVNLTNMSLIFGLFFSSLIGSSVLYVYQHRLIYLIWPYTIISALGFSQLIAVFEQFFSSRPKIKKVSIFSRCITKGKKFLFPSFFSLIIVFQLILITPVAPYFGLYYNHLFLNGKQSNEIFQIPEPVYGLDQISDYIKENSDPARVLTTNSPHILQTYLPDFEIIKEHVFQFTDNAGTMMLLRSLGFRYVIISESYLQLNSNPPLKRTLDKYGKLELVSWGGGIPLAYLYSIPDVSWNQILWQNDNETADDWIVISNSDSSFDVLKDGCLSMNLNFSAGYPPSLWYKLHKNFNQSLNLDSALLYAIFSCSPKSNVTLTFTILSNSGDTFETVLKPSTIDLANRYILFVKLNDLTWNQELTNSSEIVGIDFTAYNAMSPTLEKVVIEKVALLN